VLYVSRLEPENNAHLAIEAYKNLKTDWPLVIVGGAPYAEEYIAELKSMADERVKFLGFVFGEDYRALQQNAYCYIHATEVGGTHPALIEAMGAGNCALTLDTPENREVLGNAGLVYGSATELTQLLQRVLVDPALIQEYRRRAMTRVLQLYNWEQITDEYETLLARLAGQEVRAAVRPIASYVVPPLVEEPPAKVSRVAATTLH
jgi:glycosyltransferase involved in cell wall biosynthesis